MIFSTKTITLRNGKTAVLKTAAPEHAAEMLALLKTTAGETNFLLRYPEEWTLTEEREAEMLRGMAANPSMLPIACFVDGVVAGNSHIAFGQGMKQGHRASIGIALAKKYWGLGIGSALMEELIAAAKEHGTEIIELEYIQGNDRAKHLYEKFGFKTVSERPNTIRLKDGTYLSEFYMQKYL